MARTNKLYIGLMSGTSLDAIDAVIVNFDDGAANRTDIIGTLEYPFPDQIRARLQQLIEQPHTTNLDELGSLDQELGLLYAAAVKQLLSATGQPAAAVAAIGNHGQTIRHSPDSAPAFTTQIGNAATIANICGITTVGDFRSADIALGGQGAPLAPAFHQWAFAGQQGTVVNIGGIANITVLGNDTPLTGFDTGPGNTLMDGWFSAHHDGNYDFNGQWSASGKTAAGLLKQMLADPYFATPPPKSSGREYFNRSWLQQQLDRHASTVSAADVQATLADLTAHSIATAITEYSAGNHVWLCGGGAHNEHLVERINSALPDRSVTSTAVLGVPPSWVEAIAFAWLARNCLLNRPAGIAAVTGARGEAVLGSIHLPAKS